MTKLAPRTIDVLLDKMIEGVGPQVGGGPPIAVESEENERIRESSLGWYDLFVESKKQVVELQEENERMYESLLDIEAMLVNYPFETRCEKLIYTKVCAVLNLLARHET